MKKLIVILILGLLALASCKSDKNTFKTIKIGSQLWMSANLTVSTYRNGDSIPQIEDPIKWSKLESGAWCNYENKADSSTKYGKLYNWYAVNDPRGLAPKGWHVPTDEEWIQLLDALGEGVEAKKKNFQALCGGYRSETAHFYGANGEGNWWSSTETPDKSYAFFTLVSRSDFYRNFRDKHHGHSVRCIKDK